MGLTRDGTIFALGGGVVGDLGGFVAGTYMRGIDLVMLPTSLLAMVDSAVGGKVGVDLPEGKNLVGAFVRPRLVAANLHWLGTLPELEISNGLAEDDQDGPSIRRRLLRRSGPDPRGPDRETPTRCKTGPALHPFQGRRRRRRRDGGWSSRDPELRSHHRTRPGGRGKLQPAARLRRRLRHGRRSNLSRDRFGTDLVGVHEDLLDAAGLPRHVPAWT